MPTQTTIHLLGLTRVAHLHRSKKAGAAWSDFNAGIFTSLLSRTVIFRNNSSVDQQKFLALEAYFLACNISLYV